MKKNYNIQIIRFMDDQFYITARTDRRTRAQVEGNVNHAEWYKAKGMPVSPVLGKLVTHRIDEPINPAGLQGLSKHDAIVAKQAAIRTLRALGKTVLNTTN